MDKFECLGLDSVCQLVKQKICPLIETSTLSNGWKVPYPDDEERPVRPELMAIMQHLFLGIWRAWYVNCGMVGMFDLVRL